MLELLKIITAIALVFFIFLGISYSQTQGLHSFCSNLKKGADINTVYSLASERDFELKKSGAKNSYAVIMNHASPFFRVGCKVSIKNQLVEQAIIIPGD